MKYAQHGWREKTKDFFLSFIQTQLLMTIVSLPILVAWGLGLSVASFIGNLLGTPLLMLLLFLSTILFFSELLGIPNAWAVVACDWTVACADWCVRCGLKDWLFFFAKPPMLLLLCVPVALIWILSRPWCKGPMRRCGALAGLLCIIIIVLLFHAQRSSDQGVHGEHWHAVRGKNGEIMFFDDGFFARKQSIDKAVEYDIKPLLAKTFGSIRIGSLHILKPSQRAFEAAHAFCMHCGVDCVYMPHFEASIMTKPGWRAYFIMKETLQASGAQLVRLPSGNGFSSVGKKSVKNICK